MNTKDLKSFAQLYKDIVEGVNISENSNIKLTNAAAAKGKYHISSDGIKNTDNWKRSEKYKGDKNGHFYHLKGQMADAGGDTKKDINKFMSAVDHAHKNYKVNGPNMHGKRQSEKDHKNPDVTTHTDYSDNHPYGYTLHSDKAKKDPKLQHKSLHYGKDPLGSSQD